MRVCMRMCMCVLTHVCPLWVRLDSQTHSPGPLPWDRHPQRPTPRAHTSVPRPSEASPQEVRFFPAERRVTLRLQAGGRRHSTAEGPTPGPLDSAGAAAPGPHRPQGTREPPRERQGAVESSAPRTGGRRGEPSAPGPRHTLWWRNWSSKLWRLTGRSRGGRLGGGGCPRWPPPQKGPEFWSLRGPALGSRGHS